ncbi:unnamed protein product [[Candida] boidinii]|nr:unnamed protein product [[Candida] boidinii]GMG34502.1 unnamed protein product [[Candida] boidinii]
MIKNINKAKLIAEEQKKIKKLEQKQKQKEKQNKNDNKNGQSSSYTPTTKNSGSNLNNEVISQQTSSSNVLNNSNKRLKSTSTASEPKNKRAKNTNDSSSKIKFVMTELVGNSTDSIESVSVKKSSSLPLTSSTRESQSDVDMSRSQTQMI